MSTGYSSIFSKLSPLDWCSYLEAEGPRGLLGAPVIARLCGVEATLPGVEMEWQGVTLGSPGGLKALLAGPPRLDVRPSAKALPRGSGPYAVNPLLTRRHIPLLGVEAFPGCIESPRGFLGTPLLEPLEAREPGSCPKRPWRSSKPPRIGAGLERAEDCSEVLTPWGHRLSLCDGIAVSGRHLASLEGRKVAVRTPCLDYAVRILHPGGPIEVYASKASLNVAAVALECPGFRLYASSPWGVALTIEPGRVAVESPSDRPYAVGEGGVLDAARALFELAAPPDSRSPRGSLGHARCSNCVGSSLLEGRRLLLYTWTPTREAGLLEVRLHVPVREKAVVIDATGESWVPVERGLFRVPLPPGWHTLVIIDIEEERIWERLRLRGARGSSRPRTP
jgi:hypothetical protein